MKLGISRVHYELVKFAKIAYCFATVLTSAELIIYCDPTRFTKMADNPINLATLQQQDPYISEIMGMATQVQLYNYNKAIKNEWVSLLYHDETYYFVGFRGMG